MLLRYVIVLDAAESSAGIDADDVGTFLCKSFRNSAANTPGSACNYCYLPAKSHFLLLALVNVMRPPAGAICALRCPSLSEPQLRGAQHADPLWSRVKPIFSAAKPVMQHRICLL